MSYQDTSLWKRTLGKEDPNVEPLKNSFLRAREHAEFLLGKIRNDFENLTVHDITHVDSLWTVADTIIGEDYPINPLEGYILGIAFLIHDAALSYDTVGGKDKLRDSIEWKDAYADGPGEKDEEEFKKECDFAAIRALHAKFAEDIPTKTYKKDNGTTFYIINNDDYRTYFGELIGQIAASHHWNIDDVELKLESQINPIAEVPGDWEINAQKLACILRCADAGHIDNGRAPYNIYRSLSINGVSQNHWESQIRLGQVRPNRKDSGKLLITSTKSFKKEDFAAWNVAYDAVRIFDEELKKSNNLLNSIDEDLVFPYSGVSGANSKEELAAFIKTDGWQPCNFGVHTSNVKYLIETLGGSKLYGEYNMLLVALRELIQNARDAIHARKKLDDSFNNGRITIRLIEEGDGRYIEVEDNGIGMSMDCIKHSLLDFGSSYWKSSLSKYENPGLRSKGFISVGKFGIGFYSVFMVAKSVEVHTKRYNKAVDDATIIEFPKGLTLSPIISHDTMSTNVSTIVRFELKDDIELEFDADYEMMPEVPMQKVLPILVAALDADVYFEEQGKSQRVHEDIFSPDFDRTKWLSDLWFPCPENIDEIASKMEFLTDENGKQRGLLLPPEYRFTGVYQNKNDRVFKPAIETIGGLLASVSFLENYSISFIGYLDGKEFGVSRNKMILDESLKKCLQTWAKAKYREKYYMMIKDYHMAKSYSYLIHYCELDDIIADDNMRHLYAKTPLDINEGTMHSLKKIHYYLFVGTDFNPGLFDGHYRIKEKSSESRLDALFDSPRPVKDLDKLLSEMIDFDHESVTKEDFMRLIITSYMPASNYEEIIQKFRQYAIINMFGFGNKRALGVWVNLLLNKVLGRMIDWRNVDFKLLKTMVNDQPNELSGYLKQFLSSTYLAEMQASITI